MASDLRAAVQTAADKLQQAGKAAALVGATALLASVRGCIRLSCLQSLMPPEGR